MCAESSVGKDGGGKTKATMKTLPVSPLVMGKQQIYLLEHQCAAVAEAIEDELPLRYLR